MIGTVKSQERRARSGKRQSPNSPLSTGPRFENLPKLLAVSHSPAADGRATTAHAPCPLCRRGEYFCPTDETRLYSPGFCPRRVASGPGFTEVARAARRQNERQLSRKTGTPAGATNPNRLPRHDLPAPARPTAPTKPRNPRAPDTMVANCRQLHRQNAPTGCEARLASIAPVPTYRTPASSPAGCGACIGGTADGAGDAVRASHSE